MGVLFPTTAYFLPCAPGGPIQISHDEPLAPQILSHQCIWPVWCAFLLWHVLPDFCLSVCPHLSAASEASSPYLPEAWPLHTHLVEGSRPSEAKISVRVI